MMTEQTEEYAKIRYKHGPVHAVQAAGTAENGSLYGFYTLCGLRIEHVDDWQEEDRGHLVECGTCRLPARGTGLMTEHQGAYETTLDVDAHALAAALDTTNLPLCRHLVLLERRLSEQEQRILYLENLCSRLQEGTASWRADLPF